MMRSKQKRRAYNIRYYYRHRRALIRKSAEYLKRKLTSDPEWAIIYRRKKSARNAEYYRKNKKRLIRIMKIRHRAYYKRNRAKLCEYRRAYNRMHPEKVRQHHINTILNNPERYRMRCLVSAHRRRAAGKLTADGVARVYERNRKKYGRPTCELCGEVIGLGRHSLEHKTPISRGGSHSTRNLVVSHLRCNESKNDKTMREWVSYKAENSDVMEYLYFINTFFSVMGENVTERFSA